MVFTFSEEIPANLEDSLVRRMVGHVFPLACDALGRKFAFVVDFQSYSGMGIVCLRQNLFSSARYIAADPRSSFRNVEVESFAHKANLNEP
jgi:hypothetical protein